MPARTQLAAIPPYLAEKMRTARGVLEGERKQVTVLFADLKDSTELSEEALHRSLAQLQWAEFLYETRLFPEHEYTFKHTLTHEVAYRSLLQEQRRTLHARIMEALGGLSADRLAKQVDRIAHHVLRGEVRDKAVTYGRQAGTKAIAHSAYREAVTYIEQALGALQHLPVRPDTHAQAIDLRPLGSAHLV